LPAKHGGQTRWIYGGVDCHDQWPLQEPIDWRYRFHI
jgi:hypothetical protein